MHILKSLSLIEYYEYKNENYKYKYKPPLSKLHWDGVAAPAISPLNNLKLIHSNLPYEKFWVQM